MVYIIFWIVLDLILILLISLFGLKDLVNFLDERCNVIRHFVWKHDDFFSGLFLFVFFIEQLLLIAFVYLFNWLDSGIVLLQLLISAFALIVITTSSLQKLILEIKNRYFKSELRRVGKKNEVFLKDLKLLIDENESLKKENKFLKKKLNQKK